MNVLIVLAGDNDIDLKKLIIEKNITYIVGVDGGLNYLSEIEVDLAIGDFDSYNKKIVANQIRKLNPKKDKTDFECALDEIKETLNYSKIYVTGFRSNTRIEHFYSNLMLLEKDMYFYSNNQIITLLHPGTYLTEKWMNKYYVSFFAKKDIQNLQIIGFEYEFDDKLNKNNNLCISNKIISSGKIIFFGGELYVFLSIE